MAEKRRKKFIKMRVEEEAVMSRDALVSRLDALIDTQYRRNLNKLKGSPLCLWSRAGDDRYRLRYYHSYREDMCDTMMTLDIEKGMERCSLHGFIHKPPAIWAVFIGVIASLFIDFLIISYSLLFVQGFDLWNGLAVSACVSVVRVFICLYLLELDRSKVKILREELYRVIHDASGLPEADEDDESEEDDNA
ncbi:MAG: hypothetical protein K5876_01200 [Ruminiclostridium sp.]|nr:hypothetical protein [Ruminiclostridium sp.]